MSGQREDLGRDVNRLYWETDASVAEIADRLGISRRALYETLTPAPADATCVACGGELVYPNRSARRAEKAECRLCGREHDLSLLREVAAEAGPALRREAERREAAPAARISPPGAEPEVEQEEVAGALAPISARRAARRSRVVLLAGAAVAGLAIGAAATLLASRK